MREHLIVSKPSTETEWMMQSHSDHLLPDTRHLDAVAAAVDALPERLRTCIEGHWFERATYQVVADRLGISKPHCWRLTRQAERLVQAALLHDPLLARYAR